MKKPPVGHIKDLVPDPENARQHTPRGVGMIVDSLQEVGAARSIVIDENNVILAGNATVEAAGEAGITKLKIVEADGETIIAVRRTGLTPAQKRKLALYDNRTGELSDWEEKTLVGMLKDFTEEERFKLGFTEADLRDLDIDLSGEPGDAEPQMDMAEEVNKTWKVKLGDLWAIGEHRLLCGDCTKREDVERVMADEKTDMIFTDPPYGHKNNDGDLIQNWEKALGKPQTKSSVARPIANDGVEANEVVQAFFAIAADLLKPGCCCCCCCGGGGGPDPQFARWSLWLDAAIPFKMCVVWDKGGLGMGWHYRRNWECILVAEKPGAASKWYGGHDVPNVIRDIGKIIPSADQHPTQKPVELPAWFVKLHSQSGDTIFDPFLGSGTTMVAAQGLGRKCRGIEIHPPYVAVCLQRMKDAFPSLKIARL